MTVLDCAKEHAKSAAAAAAALATGGDPAAAAKAAQRRVWLSPKDALNVSMPAIACAANDATTIMRIFYGAAQCRKPCNQSRPTPAPCTQSRPPQTRPPRADSCMQKIRDWIDR